jgi:hypothetical protein
MLREMHEVISELQESIVSLGSVTQAGMRLSTMQLSLPVEMLPILRDGACVLLADVSRNQADTRWSPCYSQLHLSVVAIPLSEAQEVVV